ncbi:MAG: FHA domain-containing protein [Muribaculaceae bacterium]|nr:FHA domain-containing protein [Muribaculaceae bacterium]
MAIKVCKNGHKYDASIYGDKCPCCPSTINTGSFEIGQVDNPDQHTHVAFGGGDNPTTPVFGVENATARTVPVSPACETGGATVIRHATGDNTYDSATSGRKLVGILVSYAQNPLGKIYELYEGRNVMGRAATCDIPILNDSKISSQHLLILYREIENVFWLADQNSSNGSFVNGNFISDRIAINSGDIITIGDTKFVFLAIPQF